MGITNNSLRTNLELITRLNGLGTYGSQAAENFYGINYRANGLFTPSNTDQQGLTLFTKPSLNLQSGNIQQVREMSTLLVEDPYTVQRGIRALLDPWGAENSNFGTPLVNNKLPFITVLTNTCSSLSGFPDPQLGTYIAPEGPLGETWGFTDGHYRIRGAYNLTATFNNIEGNIPLRLFDFWEMYQECVNGDIMIPYPWYNYQHRMDYTTRIWRLLLDPSRRFCQSITYTGGAWPVSAPMGALGDFDSSDNFQSSNDKISIQFQAIGAIYNDPIAPFIFNRTVELQNPDMRVTNYANCHQDAGLAIAGAKDYYQVATDQRDLLNFYCYPLIHPHTWELLWYIEKEVYHSLVDTSLGDARLAEFRVNNDDLANI